MNMLDGLLGRNFSAKCKASIKLTRTRIDVIRRRRKATLKFLKKDVADLLANGLDINAYGRAEGLIAELTISSCYDFIEKSCECVLKHLSVMQKQSECPEECRIAVASLMFAAARFSDLPELRDLRHAFQEKYGNSLEYFVNKMFVENLASNPATMENKIQLMQVIASEFSIRWDSKAFERTMSKTPVSVQEQRKPYQVKDEKYKTPNGTNSVLKIDKLGILPKERLEVSTDGHISHTKKDDTLPKKEDLNYRFLGRPVISANGNKPINGRKESNSIREGREIITNGRKQLITDKPELLSLNEESKPNTHRLGNYSLRKRDVQPSNGGYKLHNEQLVNGDGQSNIPYASRNNLPGKDNYAGEHKIARGSSRGRRLEPIDGVCKIHNEPPIKDNDQDDPFASKNNQVGRNNNFVGEHKIVGSSSQGKIFESIDDVYMLHEENAVKGDGRDIPSASRVNSAGEHISSQRKRFEPIDAKYSYKGVGKHEDRHIPFASKSKHLGRDGNYVVLNDDSDIPFASKYNHPCRDKNYAGQLDMANSILQAEKTDGLKHNNNALPPPYVKPPRASKHSPSRGNNDTVFNYDGPKETSAGEKAEKILLGTNDSRDKEHKHPLDEITVDILPKPRSVRRRHSKPSSHTDINNSGERKPAKRVSNGRRRGDTRQGLQVVIDDDDEQHYCKDDEERMMDRLLLYYSKKPTSYDESEMIKRNGKAHLLCNRIKAEQDERLAIIPLPARSASLPREQTSSSEVQKVYARAASFQPERSSPAQHVHPKLPDYDDLAARFAALKGR